MNFQSLQALTRPIRTADPEIAMKAVEDRNQEFIERNLKMKVELAKDRVIALAQQGKFDEAFETIIPYIQNEFLQDVYVVTSDHGDARFVEVVSAFCNSKIWDGVGIIFRRQNKHDDARMAHEKALEDIEKILKSSKSSNDEVTLAENGDFDECMGSIYPTVLAEKMLILHHWYCNEINRPGYSGSNASDKIYPNLKQTVELFKELQENYPYSLHTGVFELAAMCFSHLCLSGMWMGESLQTLMGWVEKARTYILKAPFGRDTLIVFGNTAEFYSLLGKRKQAIKQTEMMLRKYGSEIKKIPDDHASLLSRLATLYLEERDFNKCISLSKRVLKILERRNYHSQYSIDKARAHLGAAYILSGNIAAAKRIGCFKNGQYNPEFANRYVVTLVETDIHGGPEIDKLLKEEKAFMKNLKKNEQCQTCGRNDAILKQCDRCRRAYYCSKECQEKDWKRHKKECKKFKKSSDA